MLNLKTNSFIKFFTENNFQKEIENIETIRKVKINFIDDNKLSNSEVIFEVSSDKINSKTKIKKKTIKKDNKEQIRKSTKKEKEEKNDTKIKIKNKSQKSNLKEIKNKKTGWWQK